MSGSAGAEVTAHSTIRKKGSAIGTWQTNYLGTTYTLTNTGQLQPAEQEHAWQQHDYPEPMIARNGKRSFIESSAPNSTHSPND